MKIVIQSVYERRDSQMFCSLSQDRVFFAYPTECNPISKRVFSVLSPGIDVKGEPEPGPTPARRPDSRDQTETRTIPLHVA